jgi:two-component sensor histidine kinase
MLHKILVCLILFLTSGAFGQIPVRDVTHIDAPMKLSGEWGFADEKALLPEQAETITKTLHLPEYLENRPHGAVGVATFVLDLKTTPNKPLSIDFNPLVNAWKLFIDDRLVCESGYIDVEKKIYQASPIRQVASFTPTGNMTRVTLWVANSQHRHFGIGVSPQIAPVGVLEGYHTKQAHFDLALVSVLLATGLYHLGLFFVWKRDKAPLWFGLFLMAFMVRVATTSEKIATMMFDTISWETLTRAEYISGYLTLPLFILYIGSLYQKQSNKLAERVNIGLGVVSILPVLLTSTLFFTALLPFTEVIIIESAVFVSWVLYRAFRDKEPYSVLAFITFVIFSGTIVHDVLMFAKIIDDVQDWGPIGFIFYLFAQAYILLKRYANAFYALQKHEDELEGIIALRTGELKNLLSQRELLMRELSHRVKNNLQFIIGLLWNKRVKANDETQKILLSLQSQITAIATVHETLCSQPNITSLNGGEYLRTIVDALKELYPHVQFSSTFGKHGLLSMDDTVSLGLVVSELVSNSVKHAFSPQSGAVHIEFEIENHVAKLTYTDGQTLFQSNDFAVTSRSNKGIGWSMIMELVRQLKASTSTEENVFTITFAVDGAL